MTSLAAAVRDLAVATDTRAAVVDGAYAALLAQLDAKHAHVHHAVGDTRTGRGRARTWQMTDAAAVTLLDQRLAADALPAWEVGNATAIRGALSDLAVQVAANRREADWLHQVWQVNGCWTRYFTVPGGHVHSHLSDSACSRTPTTEHGWNPELSGLPVADAVAALGPNLCTHCFPSAPVEWTVGLPKPARCAGTRRYVADSDRVGMRFYGACPVCGVRGQLTPHRLVRAHPPAAPQ